MGKDQTLTFEMSNQVLGKRLKKRLTLTGTSSGGATGHHGDHDAAVYYNTLNSFETGGPGDLRMQMKRRETGLHKHLQSENHSPYSHLLASRAYLVILPYPLC